MSSPKSIFKRQHVLFVRKSIQWCFACTFVTSTMRRPILHVLHSTCKACDNLHMRGRTSKSARNISNDVRNTTLAASPWHLLQTVIAIWFLKTNFHTFYKPKISCVQTSRVLRSKQQFHWSHLCARTATVCRNQSVKVCNRCSSPVSALSPDASQ